MSKISSLIGVVVGIVIIALAIMVFSLNANVQEADIADAQLNKVTTSDIVPPEFEENKAYGGDAYTGIQQAAAQGANNMISVFDAVVENSKAVSTLNDNLIKQTENTNKNLEEQAAANAANLKAVANLVRTCFGYLILSIGLVTEAKYLGALLSGMKKKETVVADVA